MPGPRGRWAGPRRFAPAGGAISCQLGLLASVTVIVWAFPLRRIPSVTWSPADFEAIVSARLANDVILCPSIDVMMSPPRVSV